MGVARFVRGCSDNEDKFGYGRVDSKEELMSIPAARNGEGRDSRRCDGANEVPQGTHEASMPDCGAIDRFPGRTVALAGLLTALIALAGCGHVLPVMATFRGDASANVVADATVKGAFEVKMPTAVDPGEMTATVVRPGKSAAACARIALIDVDGLLLNQNFGSLYAVGDNPLSAFRDKLEAAARDPQVAAVLLRINSPGGSVTTCDIMAEELRQFRSETAQAGGRLPDGSGNGRRVFHRR